MTWTKTKTAVVVGVTVVVGIAVVVTAIITKKIRDRKIEDYQTSLWEIRTPGFEDLSKAPPLIKIVSTKYKFGRSSSGGMMLVPEWSDRPGRMMGIGQSLTNIVEAAYGMWRDPTRVIFSTELPRDRYDFIANLPKDSSETLQRQIEKQFGIVARRETRETDVLLLTVKNPNANGLKLSPQSSTTTTIYGFGQMSCNNMKSFGLANMLKRYFKIPVIDQTGLTNNYDLSLKWDEDRQHPNPEGLKQALIDQLGLELVPTKQSIEMLVVEKAR